jgi:membrane fusion protein (multidrug efflux system)
MKTLFQLILLAAVMLHAEEVYTTFDVEAERRSDLTLTSTGVIREIRADVGDRVKKGEVLLSLDNRDLELAVELARSDVELAEINHRFAKQTYERYRKVRDVIDDDLYEQYLLGYEKSVASLRSARAKLAYNEALLEKSILRAPYDGVIAQRHKELGDGVSGARIEPVFTLIGAKRVKLLLSYDEKYWQKVKAGSRVTYRVDGSDETYTGTIAKVHPTVNPRTRKAVAELYAEGIRPGLFGEGMIEVE